jgi:hypothetical protein
MFDEIIKSVELGHTFNFADLQICFKTIWGGVSLPDKREGCAVVVGMGQERHFGSYDIYLLDEFELYDTYELIKKCFEFDFKYSTEH